MQREKRNKFLHYLLIALVLYGVSEIFYIGYNLTFDQMVEIDDLFSVTIALIIIYLIYDENKVQKSELQALRSELANSNAIRDKQDKEMAEARQAYSEVIAKQFTSWNLTKSETKTAYALLKGLSLKEVALIREIKESSVRQQASMVYQKANLEGRHALSAWFFEDFVNS